MVLLIFNNPYPLSAHQLIITISAILKSFCPFIIEFQTSNLNFKWIVLFKKANTNTDCCKCFYNIQNLQFASEKKFFFTPKSVLLKILRPLNKFSKCPSTCSQTAQSPGPTSDLGRILYILSDPSCVRKCILESIQ